MTTSIHYGNVKAATEENSYGELYDGLTSSIFRFSSFIIIFIIAIGLFTSFYFKKTLKDKKLI